MISELSSNLLQWATQQFHLVVLLWKISISHISIGAFVTTKFCQNSIIWRICLQMSNCLMEYLLADSLFLKCKCFGLPNKVATTICTNLHLNTIQFNRIENLIEIEFYKFENSNVENSQWIRKFVLLSNSANKSTVNSFTSTPSLYFNKLLITPFLKRIVNLK